MKLYPFQKRAVKAAIEAVRRSIKLLVVSAVGSGKTIMMTELVKHFYKLGGWEIILVTPRKELVTQALSKLQGSEVHEEVTVLYGRTGGQGGDTLITFGTIQSIIRRHSGNTSKEVLLLVDEAHHTPAASWVKLKGLFPKAALIGFTATPTRLDGKPLREHFDEMIEVATPLEAVPDYYTRLTKMEARAKAGLAPNGGEYAYHVTLREFLPSIERDGLLPQEHESLEEPGIFFEPDEEGAAVYHEPPNTVMLRWPLSGTPRSSTPDGEYAWYETVPPHLIEKKVKGGWVTLVKPMAPNARAPIRKMTGGCDRCHRTRVLIEHEGRLLSTSRFGDLVGLNGNVVMLRLRVLGWDKKDGHTILVPASVITDYKTPKKLGWRRYHAIGASVGQYVVLGYEPGRYRVRCTKGHEKLINNYQLTKQTCAECLRASTGWMFGGRYFSRETLARVVGITPGALAIRMKAGRSVEEAVLLKPVPGQKRSGRFADGGNR